MENIDQDNVEQVATDMEILEPPETRDVINNQPDRPDLKSLQECKTEPIAIPLLGSQDNFQIIDMEIDEELSNLPEYEYSDLSSPDISGEYIAPTGPADMFNTLTLDSSLDDNDSLMFTPDTHDSARSQLDEFPDLEEDQVESPTLQRQKTIIKTGTRNPLHAPAEMRKRRNRSSSSSREKKFSAKSWSYLEEYTVPIVPSTSKKTDDIGPLELQKVIKKLTQQTSSAQVVDYFTPPDKEYKVTYLMQKKNYQRLQDSNMDQDLIKIYLIFEMGNPISQIFALDDKMIDLISFVYMWYKSVYKTDLLYKIPIFSIKLPSARNLSKHSVHATFRKMKIQSETTIHVELIPKLDHKLRPIKLN